MSQIAKVIMAIFAAVLILDASATLFNWTLKPETTDVNKPGFIQTLSEKITNIPIWTVQIIFVFVGEIIEAVIKMVFGLIPGLGDKLMDKDLVDTSGLIPKISAT